MPAANDYVALEDLEVGTKLRVQDGGEAILVSKTWRQGDFEVYDIEVEGLHNFFVRGPGSDAPGVLVHNSTFRGIKTPYGVATQGADAASMAARGQVQEGATLYRVGTMGRSEAAGAQFWALEHPSTPGFAARYGIPAENVANADFIQTATLRPGASFVTRQAPGVGTNGGGGIEVVVPADGVVMTLFQTLGR